MNSLPSDESGLTLLELTVVFALASLVMVGLVGFYLSSQTTWLDGSTQAQTQREVTLLIETMSDKIHSASRVDVSDWPDPAHQAVALFVPDSTTSFYAYWWDSDSLIHGGPTLVPGGGGVLMSSKITSFEWLKPTNLVVTLHLIEARTASGTLVRSGASFAPYNR